MKIKQNVYRRLEPTILNEIKLDSFQESNVTEHGTGGGSPTNAAELKIQQDKIAADAEVSRLATEKANQQQQQTTNTINVEGKDYKLDVNGNAVDETGKVVYDKQKLTELSTPITEVEVDGIKFKLDDKGNAIDDKGTIVHTVEKLKEFEDNTNAPTIVASLQQHYGYNFVDKDNQPIVFPDTEEGLLQLNEAVVSEKLREAQNQFLSSNPKVLNYFKHLATGGTDEGYFNRVTNNWKDITIDKDNIEQQREIVVNRLVKTGMTKEDAAETAELHKVNNTLLKQAQSFLKQNQVEQEKTDSETEVRYQQSIKDKETADRAYYTKLEDMIIKKGLLKDFSIPENKRKDFFAFLAADVDGKGSTARDIKINQLTDEQLIQLDWLIYNNFNIDDMIKVGATTLQARTLSERAKAQGFKKLRSGEDGARKENNKANLKDINISQFQTT